MCIEQMRFWTKRLSPGIRAGCALIAMILLLCCSKQKTPDTQVSPNSYDQAEVDGLKQQVAQLKAAASQKNEELEKLQQRPAPVVTPQMPLTTDLPVQAPPPPDAGSGGVVAPQATRSAIEQDIVFQLKTCSLSGSLVKRDLLVTNKAGDRKVHFVRNDRSRFIDDSGREYPATSFALGADIGGSVSTIVPGDVSIRAQIQFAGVKPGTKKIQLLEMFCEITGSNGSKDTVLKFGAIEL